MCCGEGVVCAEPGRVELHDGWFEVELADRPPGRVAVGVDLREITVCDEVLRVREPGERDRDESSEQSGARHSVGCPAKRSVEGIGSSPGAESPRVPGSIQRESTSAGPQRGGGFFRREAVGGGDLVGMCRRTSSNRARNVSIDKSGIVDLSPVPPFADLVCFLWTVVRIGAWYIYVDRNAPVVAIFHLNYLVTPCPGGRL